MRFIQNKIRTIIVGSILLGVFCSFSTDIHLKEHKPIEYRHVILDGSNPLGTLFKFNNAIYHIQVGIDLHGKMIIMPDGCELRFDGGYLYNGIIVLNNTLLTGSRIQIMCSCTGRLSNDYVDPVWFGADPYGKEDSTMPMQMAIDIASDSKCMNFKMPSGTFLISEPLKVYRNKNIEFHGNHNTIIKAMKPMEYMITASDRSRKQYISSRFHTFVLDGNRNRPIFNESIWSFTNASSMAKGGFSFPCGFIYTQIYDVFFSNIDGWAIDVVDTYGMDYHHLSFYYCENGMSLQNANGVSISNCEFTTIRGVASLFGWGHKISFHDNVMEKIGRSAILLGSGCGPVSITSNYFEACSIIGVSLSLNDKTILKDIHFDVGILGVSSSDIKDSQTVYPIGKGYPSQVIITGNDFQEKASSRSSLVFGSAMEFSEVSYNRSYDDNIVLGTILDSKTSLVRDTQIIGNTNYKKKNKLIGVSSFYEKKESDHKTLISIVER